jgi:hypothetical protein
MCDKVIDEIKGSDYPLKLKIGTEANYMNITSESIPVIVDMLEEIHIYLTSNPEKYK